MGALAGDRPVHAQRESHHAGLDSNWGKQAPNYPPKLCPASPATAPKLIISLQLPKLHPGKNSVDV